MGATTAFAQLPPAPPEKPVTDTYFGQTVVDPYRYMENLADPQVAVWMKAQADYARAQLDAIPGRDAILAKLHDFDQRKASRVYDLSITDNDVYFYLKQTPEDETGKLYIRQGYEGAEHLLFDPHLYRHEEKATYVISSLSPNDDGTKVAVAVAQSGSESSILLVIDATTGRLSPEEIDRCWFPSASWLPDGTAFLYNRLNSADVHDPDRELNSKVFLHRVGTHPSEDRLIFSRDTNPDLDLRPEEFPIVAYDKYSKELFAVGSSVDRHVKAWYAPASALTSGSIPWKPLFTRDQEVLDFQTDADHVYAQVGKDTPNFKVVSMPLSDPDMGKATLVIPEDKDAPLTGWSLTSKGVYFARTRDGVKAEVYRIARAGDAPQELTLPFAAGSADISSKNFNFPDVWINISGWTHDFRRFRFNPDTGEFKLETLSSLAEFPEFANLTVDEVMVPSHDGVLVPLSIIHDKDLKLDGNAPTVIIGYGAYGMSMNPFFSPSWLNWTSYGGVFAIAHVRGGGELGDAWHMGGFKTTKPNTWKDLIACTEYLQKKGYTSPSKTAIWSGSAGGILVGRAMTERPDLYAAVIPEVGCMNTVRMENDPNGPVNIPEFGTMKKEDEAKALIEMDSYLHLKKGTKYPAVLVTAGMNDPRVIAWEPAKFFARLETCDASGNSILFRLDYGAGHGMGNTKSKDFEERADWMSWALQQLGVPQFQQKKS